MASVKEIIEGYQWDCREVWREVRKKAVESEGFSEADRYADCPCMPCRAARAAGHEPKKLEKP